MPESLKQISFAKLDGGMEMPHLLDIQTRAFEALLQLDAASHDREDVGLERVFKDLFPITDVHENYSLEFVRYSLGEPKYSVEECIERDMTYSAPLKATLQLVVNEEVNGQKRPRNIIEKEVYLGELPLLTPLGTFVINGAERVIVSQLHRSPGVVFEESIHPNGQRLFSARIIPFRGSWVEFTVDIHDVIYVHIDKKKKFPATALLRAFGYGSNSDILRLFFAVRDVVEPESGEVVAEAGQLLSDAVIKRIRKAGVVRVRTFAPSGRAESMLVKNTLAKDPTSRLVRKSGGETIETPVSSTEGEELALRQIYGLLRPGDAPDAATARLALERLFFSPKRYDLGRVGRYKINQRLGLTTDPGVTVLTRDDFVAILRYLVELHEGRGDVDDIDHLGNRRIRSVGELIANQFSVGLSRMARLVKERMSIN